MLLAEGAADPDRGSPSMVPVTSRVTNSPWWKPPIVVAGFWVRCSMWFDVAAAYSIRTVHWPVRSPAGAAGAVGAGWRGGLRQDRHQAVGDDPLVSRGHHVRRDGNAGLFGLAGRAPHRA